MGEHNHGMKVLSCMAVNTPHVMVGTGPKRSYWLLEAFEDNDTEQPVEEDNWAAAVEFADSVGVDIVNTSLGYYSFDDPIDNYTYRQLDGHTPLMAALPRMQQRKGYWWYAVPEIPVWMNGKITLRPMRKIYWP